jgi:hypothetical protein
VRLTLSHTDMEQEMADSVSFGWPATMSVMKMLVEAAAKAAR